MQHEIPWRDEQVCAVLLDTHVRTIQDLVKKHGPDPEDYALLDKWTQSVHNLIKKGIYQEAHVKQLREQFGEAFALDTMQGLALQKPHGYAGDFEIIDRIYLNYISPRPEVVKWDLYWQQQPQRRQCGIER